jgi:DNA repair protein RecO
MHTLSNAESVFPTRAITDDFSRLTIGLMIAEAITKTHRNEEEFPPLYNTVRETILVLTNPTTQPDSLLIAFYLRLAEHLGIDVNIVNCGVTSKPVRYQQADKFSFSLAEGCIIAPEQPSPKKNIILLPAELRALQNLSVLSLEQSYKVVLTTEMTTKFLLLFGRYFSLHLGVEVVAYSLHSLQKNLLYMEHRSL